MLDLGFNIRAPNVSMCIIIIFSFCARHKRLMNMVLKNIASKCICYFSLYEVPTHNCTVISQGNASNIHSLIKRMDLPEMMPPTLLIKISLFLSPHPPSKRKMLQNLYYTMNIIFTRCHVLTSMVYNIISSH